MNTFEIAAQVYDKLDYKDLKDEAKIKQVLKDLGHDENLSGEVKKEIVQVLSEAKQRVKESKNVDPKKKRLKESKISKYRKRLKESIGNIDDDSKIPVWEFERLVRKYGESAQDFKSAQDFLQNSNMGKGTIEDFFHPSGSTTLEDWAKLYGELIERTDFHPELSSTIDFVEANAPKFRYRKVYHVLWAEEGSFSTTVFSSDYDLTKYLIHEG